MTYFRNISGTPLGGGGGGASKVTDSGHLARLERALEVEGPVGAGLVRGGQAIVDEARFNLNDGAISGRGHIPGEPDGYSKSDTHELEESLAVQEPIEVADTIYVAAGSFGVPHAVYQELGVPSRNLLPRPNLQLATKSRGKETAPAVAEEMRKARNGTP